MAKRRVGISTLRCRLLAACGLLLTGAGVGAQQSAPEALAAALVSPAGQAAAFTTRMASPPDVPAERRRTLGGITLNGRNNAPWPAPDIEALTVARLDAAEPSSFEILAPFETTLGWPNFSPDGKWLAYAVIRDTGVEQWVAEIASGTPRPFTSAGLNAAWGAPCRWLADSSGMLCRFVVSARGSPPEAGPAADLARYYFTSQLGAVALATGRRSDLGAPDLFVRATPIPGRAELLVVRLAQPPAADPAAGSAGRLVEILDLEGNLVRTIERPF